MTMSEADRGWIETVAAIYAARPERLRALVRDLRAGSADMGRGIAAGIVARQDLEAAE